MAQPISGPLVRRNTEGYVDGTAESEEIDFDIPRGFAIEILGLEHYLRTGDHDAAIIEMETIVDLDGPGLAVGAITTEAQFDARRVLDSVIGIASLTVDMITSGASPLSLYEMNWFPVDARIITARNIGIVGLAEGASGLWDLGIWYRWLRLSEAELFGLIIDQRS